MYATANGATVVKPEIRERREREERGRGRGGLPTAHSRNIFGFYGEAYNFSFNHVESLRHAFLYHAGELHQLHFLSYIKLVSLMKRSRPVGVVTINTASQDVHAHVVCTTNLDTHNIIQHSPSNSTRTT